MHVGVIHRIQDPAGFQKAGAEAMKQGLPVGVKLPVQAYSPDGTLGLCVWEASSVEQVKELVESIVGSYSKNEYSEMAMQPPM
jgi:hypothetical protein